MDLDNKALELKAARTPFCWATVVKAEGSAPRHAGAKMIVTRDGAFGTVGGGGLEHRVIEEAREIILLGEPSLRRYSLTEDGIQPCGGEVEIFLEPVLVPHRVIVFGAGHVAEMLCPLLMDLGFELTLVDERAERIELPVFSSADHRICKLPLDALKSVEFDDDLFLICITHQHMHDEGIVRYCLDKPFRYLGLISSQKKWALFRSRYREQGFSEGQTDRVTSPIGLDIGAETPFEIAVAIVAQIIQLNTRPDDFAKGVAHFKAI